MKAIIALPILAALAVGLAACGSDDDPASNADASTDTTTGASTPAGGAVALDGLAFVATGVEGYEPVAGSELTIAFADGRLSANAGCNTMSGGYEVDADGVLVVDEAMAMTMMACDEALMEQDTWLSTFLASGPTAALAGETLTLTGEEATITLTQVQDAALEGTTWQLSGTIQNEAVSTPPAGAIASLTIADGQVAVETGCNNGAGTVEVTDSTVTFGPLATTRKACEDELTALETLTLQVLEGEASYTIDGETLVITKSTPDGDIGLQYRAGA
jgi:heat shock protein HslJ